MFRKLRTSLKTFKLTMKMKLTLSLSSIAVVLLVSSFISIMEYSRMSNYVTELIAENIGSINASQRLADASNAYNLQILEVIGENSVKRLPELRQNDFIAHCDSLKSSLNSPGMMTLADSVLYSYSAYMLTTFELQNVILSDFINAREWYFDRLQPKYNRLSSDINILNTAIYNELQKNSQTFERGFYRSIIPGAVAIILAFALLLRRILKVAMHSENTMMRLMAVAVFAWIFAMYMNNKCK